MKIKCVNDNAYTDPKETNKGMAMQLFEIVIQLGLHVYVICILQNQYCMAIDTSFAI